MQDTSHFNNIIIILHNQMKQQQQQQQQLNLKTLSAYISKKQFVRLQVGPWNLVRDYYNIVLTYWSKLFWCSVQVEEEGGVGSNSYEMRGFKSWWGLDETNVIHCSLDMCNSLMD